MPDQVKVPWKIVQFQAMQRGDYFCIYALDQDGVLWEGEVSLMFEGRPGAMEWSRVIPEQS